MLIRHAFAAIAPAKYPTNPTIPEKPDLTDHRGTTKSWEDRHLAVRYNLPNSYNLPKSTNGKGKSGIGC